MLSFPCILKLLKNPRQLFTYTNLVSVSKTGTLFKAHQLCKIGADVANEVILLIMNRDRVSDI